MPSEFGGWQQYGGGRVVHTGNTTIAVSIVKDPYLGLADIYTKEVGGTASIIQGVWLNANNGVDLSFPLS